MTEPITIRAGDLTSGHVGWTDHTGREISGVAICAFYTDGSKAYIPTDVILTLSPPAPIRRRIKWADLRDYRVADLDGFTVIETSWCQHGWGGSPDLIILEVLYSDRVQSAVIEVPVGHPLATCGEPA